MAGFNEVVKQTQGGEWVEKGFQKKEFVLQGKKINVYVGGGSERVDVKDEYSTSAGSTEFDVVIEFDDLYVDMAGSKIPEEQMWTDYQTENTRILNNHPDSKTRSTSEESTNKITEIANSANTTHGNPNAVQQYLTSVQAVTDLAQKELGEEIKGATPIVALRAGYPMTEQMGFSPDEMVLVDAKRLNKKDDKTKLALGLRFVGDKVTIMQKLQAANGKFLNADPALATGSTQLGILLWLLAEGVEVHSFNAVAVAAAQQGLEMLDKATNDLHMNGYAFSFNTVSAGIHPELTAGDHPYYIKTKYGTFAVGDGGDYLDLTLPPEYRKRWASVVTIEHIQTLSQAHSEVDWNLYLQPGAEITLVLMVQLQKALLGIDPLTYSSIFKK